MPRCHPCASSSNPTSALTAAAEQFLASHRRHRFFLYLHYESAHAPYNPPAPYKTLYASDPYSGECAYADAQLGVLFSDLEKRGGLENTIVVVTSDHGEAFGEKDETYHGFFAYNSVLQIPLFVYYPGAAPARISQNVAHCDIFPTVCDILGLPIPRHIQGESLLSLAAGAPRKRADIYFESMSPHFNLDAAPLAGLIRGSIKYIEQPIQEVYDLASDPGEERNIASSSDLQTLAAGLNVLRKEFKGEGTKQDLKGMTGDVRKFMESLSYVSGRPARKGGYGVGDDLKTLWPLVQQMNGAVDDLKAGRAELGLKKINSILRIRPIYVSAYSILSDAYFLLGRTEQALDIIHTGLSKNPDKLWRQSRNNDYGDWLNGDTLKLEGFGYPKGGSQVPKEVFATAFFQHSTSLVAKMAKAIGRADDAAKYAKLAKKVSAFPESQTLLTR